MPYAVLLCPRCKGALIADTDHETTGCKRCGKRVTVAEMRSFHTTTDAEEARRVAGAVNARQAGGEAEVERFVEEVLERRDGDGHSPATPVERAVAKAKDASGRDGKAKAAAMALADEDALTEEALAEALATLGQDPDRAGDLLLRWTRSGDLFEPTPGRYRPLRDEA